MTEKTKSYLFEVAQALNWFCIFVTILVVLTYHIPIEGTLISVIVNLIDVIKEDSINFLRGSNFADPEDFANTLTKWLL